MSLENNIKLPSSVESDKFLKVSANKIIKSTNIGESDITDLQTKVSEAETNISTLQTNATTTDTNISSLETRVTDLETNYGTAIEKTNTILGEETTT